MILGFKSSVFLTASLFSLTTSANPLPEGRLVARQQLKSPYTITVYAPDNEYLNGAKINNFNVFQAKVASYCPFTGNQASNCPNGTEMAFVGTLTPDSEVPGGQDTYVNVDGSLAVTVQHSHSFPPGSWPEYYGWSWTPLSGGYYDANMDGCPDDDDIYNCDEPTGFFTFQAPNATVGGVVVCESNNGGENHRVWAVTPLFNQTGCTEITGLGTHDYTGPNPPVWSY